MTRPWRSSSRLKEITRPCQEGTDSVSLQVTVPPNCGKSSSSQPRVRNWHRFCQEGTDTTASACCRRKFHEICQNLVTRFDAHYIAQVARTKTAVFSGEVTETKTFHLQNAYFKNKVLTFTCASRDGLSLCGLRMCGVVREPPKYI